MYLIHKTQILWLFLVVPRLISFSGGQSPQNIIVIESEICSTKSSADLICLILIQNHAICSSIPYQDPILRYISLEVCKG